MANQTHEYNLILFDLDGTLIDVFEEHATSLEKTVEDFWGIPNLLHKSKPYGLPQIKTLRLVCEASNLDHSEINDKLPRAMEFMTEQMSQLLPDDLTDRCLPGARNLLEKLETMENVHLALATGTLGSTAALLLERSGLASFFPAGAYGHERDSREKMVELAKNRGLEFYKLESDRTCIVTIGDSPADILAGKFIDAFTVSVATSMFSMDELKNYEPDVLLKNLEDTDLVISKMLQLGP